MTSQYFSIATGTTHACIIFFSKRIYYYYSAQQRGEAFGFFGELLKFYNSFKEK